MPIEFSINSNIRDYEVSIEQNQDFILALARRENTCFVVDKNVWDLYRDTILSILPESDTIILPVDEDRKNLDTVQELYQILVGRSAKRNLTLVSIGGGILQDITGFVASTLYRGINWFFIPTTLLAQADSCIGSKTSLNYHGYKNLIGTFYPPAQVFIYPAFLNSQLPNDFYSGLGEVVKLHLMGGKDLLNALTVLFQAIQNKESTAIIAAIRNSLKVKIDYMTGDEFDTGRRNLLNFGHDFGHALESTSHFAVPHGQAVIFGILAANIVANARSILRHDLEQTIAKSLLLPSLVVKPPVKALNPKEIIDAMRKDKKRSGDHLALIMMDDDYRFTKVNDLRDAEVVQTLEVLKYYLK